MHISETEPFPDFKKPDFTTYKDSKEYWTLQQVCPKPFSAQVKTKTAATMKSSYFSNDKGTDCLLIMKDLSLISHVNNVTLAFNSAKPAMSHMQ